MLTGLKDPTHTHHILYTKLQTHHKNVEATKCIQALSSSRQRPENKLMEFGGSSRAPESSLQANNPNDFLNTWPLVVKDTRVAMLLDLPCDQSYQGVESFTHFLGDSCNQSLPPPREMRHSRLWCQLQQPQLLQNQGPNLSSKDTAH